MQKKKKPSNQAKTFGSLTSSPGVPGTSVLEEVAPMESAGAEPGSQPEGDLQTCLLYTSPSPRD